MTMLECMITHSDGSKDLYDPEKLKLSLLDLEIGLNFKHINIDSIVKRISTSLPNEIMIVELIELISETLATLTTIHPDHSILGARICVTYLQKSLGSFSDQIRKLYHFFNTSTKKDAPLVSEKIYNLVMKNAKLLNASIKPERDLNFNYFGFKTLERSYLLKTTDRKILETPQYLFMRVSLGIHNDDLESAIETYNLMSERYFIHASPTLFNSGTLTSYLSSCFLIGMEEDSIDGIYKTLHKSALISKAAGGLGIHVSNIRASGSYIAGSNGTSNGLVPMLRVFNNTARYVDQGGNKRPGAFAIYLEPWHGDVLDFLSLRKNHGKEELRARDLFYALWIPDLFMQKVESNDEWYLFSPDQAPGLNEVYGEEFNKLYEKYVSEGKYLRSIRAQKLWYAILESQTETGGPFMLYKDSCNEKSNQKNLGVIKSSNLCCEVVQYSSPEEVSVCNLGSIALPTFIKFTEENIWFDFKKLHQVVNVLTKNLNKVIDVCDYPVPEAKRSNLKNRPIAIGVQGLSDVFMQLRFPFDSIEAKKLNKQIFETIYHSAIETSIELARKYGSYETYYGSPASKGLLQFDLWDHKPSDLYDWDYLKLKMNKYGLRNSLLVAPMPTASTSQILGFNESIEPLTSNIYSRRTLSGEFQLINKYLVNDLIELDIWNEDLKNEIIKRDGSIQEIPNLPQELKDLYKTVWELSQKAIIDLAADRSPFIDQSQSLNIHLKEPTMAKLTSMHFYGWKKGLKTGMYYLRTQAASSAIKFTIDQNKSIENKINGQIKNLKKRVYMSPEDEDQLDDDTLVSDDETVLPDSKKFQLHSLSVTPQSIKFDEPLDESESYDIHSITPLSCNIDEPENCESCSG
ncbi:hypothetical protein WICMUC_004046 [Wickerhamomyces mucosus]|uniref:Ribonucleoside-diphosphate reductase n=1 Tax=Wickerhamomyces mucosus TaxID=1378264 RepID=A0A9P8PK81_9ASCO|nr:hypothetical protein WICMUC_004046 [Wickerhamomyces mucosus]